MYEKKPWLKFYNDVPPTIDYPQVSMYERFMQTVKKFPKSIATDFMGTTQTYAEMGKEIDQFADALVAFGVKAGDVMTISMPTAPKEAPTKPVTVRISLRIRCWCCTRFITPATKLSSSGVS